MDIYMSAILLSLTLIWITNTVFSEKRSFGYYFLSIISLLPPTIIAGIRDLTIGTDIRHYISPNFGAAQNYNSLLNYVNDINNIKTGFVDTVNHTEMGYSVLVYFISRISDNPQWLLFALQAITVTSLYIGLNLFQTKNQKISVTLGMLVYYTIFYGPSLNIMRQTLAAALIFLSFSLLYRNFNIRSLIVLIIATQFHLSSMITIVYYIIYLYIRKRKKNKVELLLPSSMYLIIIFALVVIVGPSIFKGLEYLISQISFLQKYSASLDNTGGYSVLGAFLFVVSDFVLFIFLNIIEKIQGSMIFTKEDHLSYLFFIASIISTFFFGIYTFQDVVPRLGMFFSIFRVVSYSYYISKIKNVSLRIIIIFIMTVVLFAIFFKVTLSGSGEIFPYNSEVLSNIMNNII